MSGSSDDEYEYEYEYSDDEEDDLDDSDCKVGSDASNATTTKKLLLDNAHTTTVLMDTANPNAPPPFESDNTFHGAGGVQRIKMIQAQDLWPVRQQLVTEVSEALGVPLEAAAPLLRCHEWKLQQVLQAYDTNPHQVLQQAGVAARCRDNGNINGNGSDGTSPAAKSSSKVLSSLTCQICLESVEPTDLFGMPCDHQFCIDCWNAYVTNAIEEQGMACVVATCPQATCPEILTEKEVAKAAPLLAAKFQHYSLRSFVDTNPQLRWCPGNVTSSSNSASTSTTTGTSTSTNKNKSPKKHKGNNDTTTTNTTSMTTDTTKPDKTHQSSSSSYFKARCCERVACYDTAFGTRRSTSINQNSATTTLTNYNNNQDAAHCHLCRISFCMACGEEPHAPASCRDVSLWTSKNTNGTSETAQWITAHTKTCPKCCARIQKDGGCMYIMCQKCRHGFCWMCRGTHHVLQCNAYTKEQDATADAAAKAKNELERYLHYYERYFGHAQAQDFATKQVEKLEQMVLDGTTTDNNNNNNDNDNHDATIPLLQHANEQLVTCRRILKFTYVFAYYHFDRHPHLHQEKQCFEHHQGILEGLTESLSKLTELPWSEVALDHNRLDIINRTRVIGQFIHNVLEHVDAGMV